MKLLGDVLAVVEDEGLRAALEARIAALNARLAAEDAETSLAAINDACFELCGDLLEALRAQQVTHRAELRRIVTLIRETARMLVGDGRAFSDDIEHAATRFQSLLRVDDVHQLKERLVAEIRGLQAVASERQQRWQRSIATFEDRIATLEEQLSAVRQEASHDPLTGIFNRRYFEGRLEEVIASPGRTFSLAVVDLDDFKAVNDRGGHAAGDRVLQAVAAALRTSVRRDDVVARVGGDEFALLANGASLPDAEARTRSLVVALSQIATGLESPSHVSVSCGLAEFCAGDTRETLTRRADQALYEAKRQGKNRVVVKSPPFIRDLLK